MPFLSVAHGNIHYVVTGVRSAPPLVLSNSLGTNFSMWDTQLAEFEQHFCVVRYDTRGHGQSAVTDGPYSFELLGGDVIALLDELNIARAHFCGLSMGGMTGMWLGLHAAQRLQKLVISSASARFGSADGWNARIEKVRKDGMKQVAAMVLERWFTTEFLRNPSPSVRANVDRTLQVLESTSPTGYIACCAALRDTDLRESVSAIRTPTLIISGSSDPVSPPVDGKYLAAHIPGARHQELRGAHLCNIEAPSDFTNAVLSFLTV